MVHIMTKYPIKEEDAQLLSKGKMWWLKCNTTNSFVKGFPKIACIEPVDIEMDLEDGEYTMGCGDWNTKNEEGRAISQKVYFYIDGGRMHYCKKWADLPSQSGCTQKWNTDGGWGKTEEKKEEPKEEYFIFPGMTLCLKRKATVDDADGVGIASICEDFEASIPSDGDDCANCVHNRMIYFKQ